VYWCTNPPTAKILRQLEGKGDVEIDIRVRGKDEASARESSSAAQDSALMRAEVIPDLVLSLGDGKVGTLPKDKPQGKLVDEWNQA
jgi:nucleosome binding factor SPN SPT16 subunit